MQRYLFKDQQLAPGDHQWDSAIASAHAERFRPLCLCRPDSVGIEVYVARSNERWILKRMPFSGSEHSPGCDHYEPPPELSGYGEVCGGAIRDDTETGGTALALDFSLTKGPSRNASPAGAAEQNSVTADSKKLTLRGTLHYLYDQANLTRWMPRMLGRRSWFIVRRELLEAAVGKKTKGLDLGGALLIPEVFSSERVDEIKFNRHAALTRLSHSSANRMIVVAPLKEFRQSRFGFHMVLKHLPDMPLQMDDELHGQIVKWFASELAVWDALEETHLLVIGTFSKPQEGIFRLESACLANVDANWLPFDGLNEHALLAQLVKDGRRFTKGLRYNLKRQRPLASAVLQDVGRPVALYVIPSDASETFRDDLRRLIEGSGVGAWCWDVALGGMPQLPTEDDSAIDGGDAGSVK